MLSTLHCKSKNEKEIDLRMNVFYLFERQSHTITAVIKKLQPEFKFPAKIETAFFQMLVIKS